MRSAARADRAAGIIERMINSPRPSPTALVIHGGAGVSSRASISDEDEIAIRKDLDLALDAGQQVLASGGTALDAVAAAVVVLEDSPWFNAGASPEKC